MTSLNQSRISPTRDDLVCTHPDYSTSTKLQYTSLPIIITPDIPIPNRFPTVGVNYVDSGTVISPISSSPRLAPVALNSSRKAS